MASNNEIIANLVAKALARNNYRIEGYDDSGDDDSGDDDSGDDDSGARGRRRRRGRRDRRDNTSEENLMRDLPPELRQQVQAARTAQLVEKQQLGFTPKPGNFLGVLGIPMVTVAAGASGRVRAPAEEPTQISRLSFTAFDPLGVIPPEQCACYMGITNIRIGTQSIFSTTEPAALDSFNSRATLVNIQTRILTTGQGLTIDYQNDHPTANFLVRGTGFGPTP